MKTHIHTPNSGTTHVGCIPKQQGAALFIALIALVSMTLAGIAMVRSVDTNNLISGNLAFRESALHTTDIGIETAVNALATIVTTSLNANYPSGCTSGCSYYALMQATDSRGVPTIINWANVPNTTVNTDYSVQYVIDRLCTGTLPVTNVTGNCYSNTPTSGGGGSKKSSSTSFTSATLVYYRVTVRVTGPRNTTSMVQAIVSS